MRYLEFLLLQEFQDLQVTILLHLRVQFHQIIEWQLHNLTIHAIRVMSLLDIK